MKYIKIIALSLIFSFSGVSFGAIPKDAEALVKRTAEQVIAKVKNEKGLLQSDPKRLHLLVDEYIVPHFDFARMSQWVLGKFWKNATEQQRLQFVEEFRKLLIRTYAFALLEYSDRKINYLPVNETSDVSNITVKTEIERPGNSSVPIVYRMYSKDNDWKVYDVTVGGVSLVTTYRASFVSEIRKQGIDGLITSLVAKNAKLTKKN